MKPMQDPQDLRDRMCQACEQGDLRTIEELAAWGFELDQQLQPTAGTALHVAASNAQDQACQLLISLGADVASGDHQHCTPLHRAAAKAHATTCTILLDAGAPVNARAIVGQTPLHDAKADVCTLLINAGADVNARCKDGQSLLHHAAYMDDVTKAEILIRHGALVDARNREMETPLHWAAKLGRADFCQMLLAHGAMARVYDRHGHTPVHACAANVHPAPCRVLVAAGLSPDEPASNGELPIVLTASLLNYEMALELVKLGANIDARDSLGRDLIEQASNPQHWSGPRADRHILYCLHLINAGADPRAALQGEIKGAMARALRHPLAEAAQRGLDTVCLGLIERGHDPMKKGGRRESPVEVARRTGRPQLADAMLAARARVVASSLMTELLESPAP